VEPGQELERVKSIKEMDGAKGFAAQQDDGTVEIAQSQRVELGRRGDLVGGGER